MLLFASDTHLSAHRPAAVAAFVEFLAGPVRRADRLYLLGDVFDLWLGDDDDRAPHPEVEAALAEAVSAGVPIDLMRGNHDFLLGAALAERTGCRLIDEPHIIEAIDERTVLLHGDTLCTRDVEYQAFRRYARDPVNQRAFLARPMEERAQEAAKIRATSDSRTRLKPEDIMDVTDDEVARVLSECGATRMIHGHTHRPGVHEIGLETGPATRIVLGDWYERGTVLIWDETSVRLARPEHLSA
ncbi:MAG: UDP-2,3-diacylglucosamine diphosphatase [Thiotrichales bacterium]|nr:UDP-2,3-diacylglucosamine diphosphatase [Thiotrichales bacterium]